MSVSYVVDNQVTELGVIVSRPNVDLQYSDDEIVEILDRVMRSKIIPLVMTVREEYFVTYQDFDLNVGDSNAIKIPTDAIGMKLRQVAQVASNQPQNVVTMPRLELEQVNGTFPNQPIPQGYYIQNNSILIWPLPIAQMTVRVYYLKRPLKLTLSTNCRQILEIDTVTNTVTLSGDVPSDWETGDSFSATSSEPGFESTTITPLTVNGSLMTFTDVTDTELEVGDWIATLGYSCISQIPVELFELLTQGGACEYQKGLGDTEGYQKLKVDYEDLKKSALDVITQRVEGVNKKVTTNGNGIADWCGYPGVRGFR